MRAWIFWVALLAGCGGTPAAPTDDACSNRIEEARSCLEVYCSHEHSAFCACVAMGKDVSAGCTCSSPLEDTLRASVCTNPDAPLRCADLSASLAELSGHACDLCSVDDECGDRICEAGRCVDGCREDAACPEQDGHWTICEEMQCVIGCRTDVHCFEGELDRICEGDRCREGCREDIDCFKDRLDRICDGTHCRDGCRKDIDCYDGKVCLNTYCVSP